MAGGGIGMEDVVNSFLHLIGKHFLEGGMAEGCIVFKPSGKIGGLAHQFVEVVNGIFFHYIVLVLPVPCRNGIDASVPIQVKGINSQWKLIAYLKR